MSELPDVIGIQLRKKFGRFAFYLMRKMLVRDGL